MIKWNEIPNYLSKKKKKWDAELLAHHTESGSTPWPKPPSDAYAPPPILPKGSFIEYIQSSWQH